MAIGASVGDANFEEQVLNSAGVTLVDFWADWCTPCKMLEPALEEVKVEMQENKDFKMVNLDVDANPETAGSYGVMSIPTLLLFKGGQVKAQLVGVRPKDEILEAVKRLMSE